jgi:hypothetical protein
MRPARSASKGMTDSPLLALRASCCEAQPMSKGPFTGPLEPIGNCCYRIPK